MIGSQAYRLVLPSQYSRLYDMFPIQVLELYYLREEEELLPMPDLEDDPEEYEVEEIRSKKETNG